MVLEEQGLLQQFYLPQTARPVTLRGGGASVGNKLLIVVSNFKQPRRSQTRLRDLAARAPEFGWNVLSSEIRGRRECRALDAPAASRAK
jgi:hypothetical protein